MGKVLKSVAIGVAVIGLAVATGGISIAPSTGLLGFSVATSGILGSLALTAGAGLILGGLEGALAKKPQVSGSSIDRLHADLVLDTPRKLAFGETALHTDIRYQEWWGASQEYCSQVIVVASHWCEAIEQIWFEDKLAWSLTGGVQGDSAGYLSVGQHAQAKSDSASVYTNDWSNRWGSSCTFTGCATVYLQFKVTGNNSKATSPFSSSIPSRITIRGKAARLYDPRRDSTAGGSGTMRANDQTTWAYTYDGVEIGRNPALQMLFWLLGWRINGKLAVGCGLPADRIDLDSFITAANMCDESVLKADGTTEPRYRGDGTFSEGDDPKQIIATFEATMNAKLRDRGGKLSLQLFHNDLATPVLDFTDDDVLGDFVWTPGQSLESKKNLVRGRYTDPSDSSLYQLVDYPAVSLTSLDGIDRIETLDLPLVQSPSQAQRLANQHLERLQYPGSFAASFNAKGWGVQDGDVVRLTFRALGFDAKLFRVDQGTIDVTGVCPLVLIEEHAVIYAWDADERPAVVAAAPIVYDPLLHPLVQAVSAVADQALQLAVLNSWIVQVSAGLTVVTAGADGTITIANFTRRYADGHPDVAVTGATIASGLSAGDVRSLAYDDPNRVGGSVSYALYSDDNDAHASSAHAGRHYMGYIVIPTTGSAGGGGGGVVGGRCVTDDTPILMADDRRAGPGVEKVAADLRVGDWLWTQHEVTLAFGAYRISAIDHAEEDVLRADGLPRATAAHRFWRGGGWLRMDAIGVADGRAMVARITVEDAHTYISAGVLSHNIKDEPDE